MATAFTSLMHLITQLHEHQLPPIQLEEKQVDSLSSIIGFFQRFLEVHHNAIDHELEFRIADAAHQSSAKTRIISVVPFNDLQMRAVSVAKCKIIMEKEK